MQNATYQESEDTIRCTFSPSPHFSTVAPDSFEAMSEPLPQPKENTSPFFTRPLEDAANRYIDAHAEVISRREEKRVRHARQWAQWKHSND